MYDALPFAALAITAKQRINDFKPQEVANLAWAFATAARSETQLSAALAKVTEKRVGECTAQNLANTAWAFAKWRWPDAPLFTVFAEAAEQRPNEFGPQELAIAAWAFATACQQAPYVFNPASVLDAIGAKAAQPTVISYQLCMQGLAAVDQLLEVGVVVLARAESSGLLSEGADCYPMFRTLLEVYRTIGDSTGIAWIQAVLKRLSFVVLTPVASSTLQGSERWYDNGIRGEGIGDALRLWSDLRGRMSYTPQVQALPWKFMHTNTRKMQEGSLMSHGEKKALGVLISYGTAQLSVSVDINPCMDCHEFFKSSSRLFGRRIQLRSPKMAHTFIDGQCSCKDLWRWEVRLTPPV